MTRVSKRRSLAEIYIHESDRRSFEWYWNPRNAMPGLDAFELLDSDRQDDFTSRLRVWGDLPIGTMPSQSQVNIENKKPLILAIKVGSYRFPAFHAEGSDAWVVTAPYLKKGQKRDSRGDNAIARAIKERQDYETRTKQKDYYQRDDAQNT